MLNFFDFLLV